MPADKTLKSDHYSNCLMLHPDGTPMFRCGIEKLNWYVSKNLAKVETSDPLVAIFTFEPVGFGWAYDDYFLECKKNICLTRHHVIPYCYRKHFPEESKSHNSYDIVLVCNTHHDKYELKALELKQELAIKHRAPLNGVGGSYDKRSSRVNSYKKTLLRKDSASIPQHRQDKMLKYIQTVLISLNKISSEQAVTKDFLLNLEDLDYSVPPHTEHGKVVISNYDIDDFAIIWRQHFVEQTRPNFLPAYWSVDRRVYQEAKERRILESPFKGKHDPRIPSEYERLPSLNVEIERRFLLKSPLQWLADFKNIYPSKRITQFYLSYEPAVRVRISGHLTDCQAYITVKGKPSVTCLTRPEFEWEIPAKDAKTMLTVRTLIKGDPILKTRYKINHAGLDWEVDIFEGLNQGLAIAEVELQSEKQKIELPSWVGEEVTMDHRYSNSSLAQKPFSDWLK